MNLPEVQNYPLCRSWNSSETRGLTGTDFFCLVNLASNEFALYIALCKVFIACKPYKPVRVSTLIACFREDSHALSTCDPFLQQVQSCKENDTPWHFTVRTLSRSNRFRTRKFQNASREYYIILKFSRSKTIGFWQSSPSEMSTVKALFKKSQRRSPGSPPKWEAKPPCNSYFNDCKFYFQN